MLCVNQQSSGELIWMPMWSAFTTDNGSNIVKALKDDLKKIHVPCAGHTLNLSVQSALGISGLSSALARCRKVVGHFNHSRVDRESLLSKQSLLDLPKHSITQDVTTRWNSTHDMIQRLCEQQPAIAAVLHRRRDLAHLEISSQEWRLLEDVASLLEPFKDSTMYLSAESYPTISVLGPFVAEIKSKIAPTPQDAPVIKQFKLALATDMNKRYAEDSDTTLILNKASFLDPRFKRLAHPLYIPAERNHHIRN